MIPMPLRALLYRRPSEPSAISIAFEREVYLVRVRRHRQARRYTLRIHTATREVVLTMPPRGSLKQAREFAQRHGAWIAARLERLPDAAPFAHDTVLPLRGVDHRIVHKRGARGTVWIESGEASEPLLCVAGQAPHIPRRVRDFLKREAKGDLEAASGRAADALELSGGGFVLMAKDRATADAMAAATAQTLGIENNESVRTSLQVLIGTPDDVKRELAVRIEKFGMTYFFLNFMMPDTIEMFAKEVMPAFARQG